MTNNLPVTYLGLKTGPPLVNQFIAFIEGVCVPPVS